MAKCQFFFKEKCEQQVSFIAFGLDTNQEKDKEQIEKKSQQVIVGIGRGKK
ncbi:hypothetical protein [Thermoactinomyces mirandus]|uniref:Uncharacterized protein n=1 Tax=Thermoactinomyces mirandus TaxID=2756294 RepID=A0A7W2AQQ0_9BACL|nr:hypothetical protein [Thermoactinomyces mirandus]MBA4601733.1 hypothetical protein [Thermoactinomyces mirandus]